MPLFLSRAGRIRLRRCLRNQHRSSIPSLSLVCVCLPQWELPTFVRNAGQIYCAVKVKPLSMVAVTGMSSFPRSALARFSQPALTPFGMSESKTSYRIFLEFCKNDFTSSQGYSICAHSWFLTKHAAGSRSGSRLHNLSPWLHHQNNKKYV